ncbi:MAG: type I-C CRISPR-associated protein Cas8c/Csd1 [Candidatus Gastranaerophilales bacterium]|nr:type I-C CRISPR-associated protein Cas8c/Csd1 [Candidatus Gastranaerophilales bacterium]
MNWMQRLYETYENCQSMIGKIEDDSKVPLLPICHTTQKAQIEIVIDGEGNFQRARVVPKGQARTIIPCTEASGGRTSGEAAHPLCDKLQYVAADYHKYGGKKASYFKKYQSELNKWCEEECFKHPKAMAVFKYIGKKEVIKDLVNNNVLVTDGYGKLSEKGTKSEDLPEIFQLLNDQSEAFIRWEVEIPGKACSKAWEDATLWDCWIKYYLSTKKDKAFCCITGKEEIFADQHPAKIRNDGDKAKLISSNDISGFTFRGRFTEANQACVVSYGVTQMAHSALRWLISRQGYRSGDQVIVAWAVSGEQIPKPVDDAFTILGEENLVSDNTASISTAQELALKLRNKIAGYKTHLGETTGIVVMGLDSATPGRMAITYYRELTGSDFLKCLDRWHNSCAWMHDYRFIEEAQEKKVKRKHLRFVGAPSPKDIAEAAYGVKMDDKLKKATIERILPCIIDGRQIPRDIVESIVRRASHSVGLENWEWNKVFSIACALYRKLNEKEGYDMALEEGRKTRDYLYGRLLALADSLERWALSKAGEDRQTNAARLIQRFSEHPYSTWKIIELSLAPYKARLGVQSLKRQSMITQVVAMFEYDDYTNDKRLSGEFLLGYHCQREALKSKNEDNDSEKESVTIEIE